MLKSGSAVKCRLDWHQTGSAVYVSIFAKKYDPDLSSVQLSPVRLKLCLVFPEQGGSFEHDIELRGVSINTGISCVSILFYAMGRSCSSRKGLWCTPVMVTLALLEDP